MQVFILGLLTVFLVLLVVVGTGNAIIRFVNRYMGAASHHPVIAKHPGYTAASKSIAAITAAVHSVTKGKGKVEKIEKQG